jgi:hypothetical protein
MPYLNPLCLFVNVCAIVVFPVTEIKKFKKKQFIYYVHTFNFKKKRKKTPVAKTKQPPTIFVEFPYHIIDAFGVFFSRYSTTVWYKLPTFLLL